MRDKFLNNYEYIFLLFVGITCFIPIMIFPDILIYGNKTKTVAEIVEIDKNIYVEYKVNNELYKSKLNTKSPLFYEGKKITIYYYNNNPSEIIDNFTIIMFLSFILSGIILMIIGSKGIIKNLIKEHEAQMLKRNGKLIYANYVETIPNRSIRINKKHPYNIICEWINPLDNEKYTFNSTNLWDNPKTYIMNQNILQIPVYVDPNNINKYVVDVDSFLKLEK